MFQRFQHIHFIGIGGIGMSGIAEVLANLGFRVSGSDIKHSDVTMRLQELGVQVTEGHAAENVGDAHVVVRSTAVRDDNPEIVGARGRSIPVIPRAEMLAELMRMKPHTVAVAGSHGKTTTTSMVATVLGIAGLDPTFVIGGIVRTYRANARLGRSDLMVVEADESDRSFLMLTPTIAVVTNIDREHMDYYHDMEDVRKCFADFVNKVPFYGAAILCLDDPQPAVARGIPGFRSAGLLAALQAGLWRALDRRRGHRAVPGSFGLRRHQLSQQRRRGRGADP